MPKRGITILGVDENGYGPILGPLVVTGVTLELKEGNPFEKLQLKNLQLPLSITDSKILFKRNPKGYEKLEKTAHAILNLCDIKVDSFFELLQKVVWGGREKISKDANWLYVDFPLPVWQKEKPIFYLRNSLQNYGITLKGIKSIVLLPSGFNHALEKEGNKLMVDSQLFLELLQDAKETKIAMLGKLGATRVYHKIFSRSKVKIKRIIKEEKNCSSYILDINGRKLEAHFLLDGDREYLPIAASSIVGKYLRELFMLALNHLCGYKSKIPYASGYGHDSHTYELVKYLKDLSTRTNLPLTVFLRER